MPKTSIVPPIKGCIMLGVADSRSSIKQDTNIQKTRSKSTAFIDTNILKLMRILDSQEVNETKHMLAK